MFESAQIKARQRLNLRCKNRAQFIAENRKETK